MKKLLAMALLLALNGTAGAITIETLPATNVQLYTAEIAADVTSTGAAAPEVWFFWGLADGVTNKAAWTATNLYGTASTTGRVSVVVSNLTMGQVYRWRAYATNAVTEDWSTATALFTSRFVTVRTRSLTINSNDAIANATNFLAANDIARASDLAGKASLDETNTFTEPVYAPTITAETVRASAYYVGETNLLDMIPSEGGIDGPVTNDIYIAWAGGVESYRIHFSDSASTTNTLTCKSRQLSWRRSGESSFSPILNTSNLSNYVDWVVSIASFNNWSTNAVKYHAAPTSNTQHGSVGQIGTDATNLYIYARDGGGTGTNWMRIPGSFQW